VTQPTPEFLERANRVIRATLLELRPRLLEAHGSIEHRLKDDKSVVTEMDVLVEKRIHEALHNLDPAIGLAGEETGADLDQPLFWLVDPIDGTESFIRGLPFSTNMIALIYKGEPIMGVIYNFFLDEYFHAVKGGGATMNGHPIRVSDRSLDRAYIILGTKIKNPALIGITDRLRLKVAGMPKAATGGYEFTAMARGAIEGRIVFDTTGKAWDFAPGTLLVKEAGGRVENLHTRTYDYRDTEFVIGNQVVFDELKTFIEAELEAVE